MLVRNCTKRQRSHRTTSRESTGVSVVAIQVLRVPERATLKANYNVMSGIEPVEVKTKLRKTKPLSGRAQTRTYKIGRKHGERWGNRESARGCLVFTNCIRRYVARHWKQLIPNRWHKILRGLRVNECDSDVSTDTLSAIWKRQSRSLSPRHRPKEFRPVLRVCTPSYATGPSLHP